MEESMTDVSEQGSETQSDANAAGVIPAAFLFLKNIRTQDGAKTLSLMTIYGK